MNKKDISEIKKTLKPENSSIGLIRTCYVDGEKNIIASHKSSFLSLDEEEQHKYMAILKKAMSGKLNHSLLNLEFPDEAEQDGGTQNRLYKMMKDGLQDNDMADLFFEELANTYVHTGNYLILLAYGNYGIPSRASDGADLGESEYVYSFFICCLCPVDLSKPGLCYSHNDKTFVNAERDWIAGNPEIAFTFPAFSDRQMDIHHALYYTKKGTEPHEEISDTILGCALPMAADDQKEAFKEIVQESLGENANICNIVNLNREIESYVDDMERDDAIKKRVINVSDDVKEVIDYVSQKVGKHFDYANSYVKNINSLFAAGYTKEDMIAVVDQRFADLSGTKEFNVMMNPSKLFFIKTFPVFLRNAKGNSDLTMTPEQLAQDAKEKEE